MNRYFSTQRPIALGTCPKGFVYHKNFDDKIKPNIYTDPVWGYVLYDGELPNYVAEAYELMYDGRYRSLMEMFMFDAGMTPHDMTLKTGIPEERVRQIMLRYEQPSQMEAMMISTALNCRIGEIK